MPVYRDDAVVLRTHKLGEADRIITLLTRSHGAVRAVAKGVRRTASKFGSRLEPFMVADVQLYKGRSLDIVTQAETLGAYGAVIANDYAGYMAASAMVEMAERVTESVGSEQQYLLLVGGLRSLSRGEHDAQLTRDSYLLRALSMAGWAPRFDRCAQCGTTDSLNTVLVQQGGVVCKGCAPIGAVGCGQDAVGVLSALLVGDWDHAESADHRTRKFASDAIAAYTQWHLERGLRSLSPALRYASSLNAAQNG